MKKSERRRLSRIMFNECLSYVEPIIVNGKIRGVKGLRTPP